MRRAFSSKPITAFPEGAKIKIGNVPLLSSFPSKKPDCVPSLTNPSNLCKSTSSHFSFSSPAVFCALCCNDCPGQVMSFVGAGGCRHSVMAAVVALQRHREGPAGAGERGSGGSWAQHRAINALYSPTGGWGLCPVCPDVPRACESVHLHICMYTSSSNNSAAAPTGRALNSAQGCSALAHRNSSTCWKEFEAEDTSGWFWLRAHSCLGTSESLFRSSSLFGNIPSCPAQGTAVPLGQVCKPVESLEGFLQPQNRYITIYIDLSPTQTCHKPLFLLSVQGTGTLWGSAWARCRVRPAPCSGSSQGFALSPEHAASLLSFLCSFLTKWFVSPGAWSLLFPCPQSPQRAELGSPLGAQGWQKGTGSGAELGSACRARAAAEFGAAHLLCPCPTCTHLQGTSPWPSRVNMPSTGGSKPLLFPTSPGQPPRAINEP